MTIIVSVMCRPKIVLVECVGHSSVVCYLAQVLEPLAELVILQFSNVSLDKDLHTESISFYSFSDRASLVAILSELKSNSFSHVIVVSAGNLGYLLASAFESIELPFSVLAHNLHYELNRQVDIVPSFISFIRMLKWVWRLSVRNRLDLAKKSQGIIVSCKNSAQLAREMLPALNVLEVPWAISPDNSVQYSTARARRILLLGGISNSRRDFNEVLTILNKYNSTLLKFDIVGDVVGRNGRKILKSLVDYPNVNFHGRLDTFSLERLIKKIDVFWLPMSNTVSYLYFSEKAGVSKISGIIHDAIRFGKPVLINTNYNLSKELASIAKTYVNAEDFIEIVNNPIIFAPPDNSSLSVQRSLWRNYLRSVGVYV